MPLPADVCPWSAVQIGIAYCRGEPFVGTALLEKERLLEISHVGERSTIGIGHGHTENRHIAGFRMQTPGGMREHQLYSRQREGSKLVRLPRSSERPPSCCAKRVLIDRYCSSFRTPRVQLSTNFGRGNPRDVTPFVPFRLHFHVQLLLAKDPIVFIRVRRCERRSFFVEIRFPPNFYTHGGG